MIFWQSVQYLSIFNWFKRLLLLRLLKLYLNQTLFYIFKATNNNEIYKQQWNSMRKQLYWMFNLSLYCMHIFYNAISYLNVRIRFYLLQLISCKWEIENQSIGVRNKWSTCRSHWFGLQFLVCWESLAVTINI